MRLFINYSFDMMRRKTDRINLSQVETTDQLILEIASKLNTTDSFYVRFMIDGGYVRVIPGWPLSHYGIKHGSTLHIEFFEPSFLSSEPASPTRESYLGPSRKLSKIQEDMEEEEENIRNRQDTALSKTSKTSGISSISNEDEAFDDDHFRLLKAAKEGDLAQVKSLLSDNSLLLDQLGDSGWAIIHYAVFYDHIPILSHIISMGADPNLVTSDGWNALQLSIKKKNISTLTTLLAIKGVDVNKVTEKGTALHIAVKMNLQKFVDILVARKADDSLRDDMGKTPVDVCEDDDIRMSLIMPERLRPREDSSVRVNVYKGTVYRVKFLLYSMEENYLVCDPIEGTLKRYENKQNYPKKPKQVIPILQITSFQMMKKEDRHMLMRKGYEYFEVFCPDRLILATKSKELSSRWIRALFECHLQVHNKKDDDHVPGIPPKINLVELVDEPESVEQPKSKLEAIGFKKEKEKEKDKIVSTPRILETPKIKKSDSVFTKHLHESREFHRAKSQKVICETAPVESEGSSTIDFLRDSGDLKPPALGGEVRVSKWEDEEREKECRSSGDSFESNKKDNSSTMAEESRIGISSFEIIKELGSGSFGKVFLAKLHRSKEMFALKALKKSALILRKHLKYAIGEANVLKKLNSPFIVQLHYAFQTPHYLYLCLDYCPNGDLSQYLANQEDGVISEQEAKMILAQLILAMEHMHKSNIVYRDMKPENVLIGADGFIRLADFGLSKGDVTNNHCASFCGSPAYLSPEMLKQKGVGKESDVYGLGCILYEMLTGEPPYYHDDLNILYQNIQKGNLKFPARLSTGAKDLIQKLLQREPMKRISLERVKQHPFLKEVDFGALSRKEIGQVNLSSIDKEEDSEDQDIKLSDHKKPIFIDADYPDDKKINKVSNFSFSR